MSEPYLAIRVVMMPRDTNPLGSMGGVVIGDTVLVPEGHHENRR